MLDHNQGADSEPPARVVSQTSGDRACIRLASSPGALPDEAINALREGVVEALSHHPRGVVLDLSASPGADSRLVALTCEAMRLCRRQRARLVVRCTPELRAWLIVYHIPGLRRVLEVRQPARADEPLRGRTPSSTPASPLTAPF